MALRLLRSRCWIVTNQGREGDENTTYMFCQTKLRGMRCPLKEIPGKIAFELSSDCFEAVRKESPCKKQRNL
ncbi:MAG: hypothetical protein IH630_08260 [Thermoplasmata archaeon]|nr:hypothetical protein [Thermoplasmata archaeon]TFG70194.1 MAG: hypothetical protein E4H25_02855 [Methanomassiliicoccus sp.]